MLIAMAITLLMMAAVVTLFANISSSVSKRRATIEMSTQMQQVRAMLQRDLAGATCPAVPWQRPESNHGYIEIIEGAQSDANPSPWISDSDNDGIGDGFGTSLPGIDLAVSSLPSSNLLAAGKSTDCMGLGDSDDILMLTVRNEKEPFVGRAPSNVTVDSTNMPAWGYQSIESQLAEVVWYAVENPPSGIAPNTFYFGEPGYRTIYRRTLLIAPQLNYSYRIGPSGSQVVTGPGVLRVLPAGLDITEVDRAFAALVAFQEKYDISARVEWDPLLPNGTNGRWKIVANTLGDLTKRENRYEHHGIAMIGGVAGRVFPYAVASIGANVSSGNLLMVADSEYGAANSTNGQAVRNADLQVVATTTSGALFPVRPLVRPNADNPIPFMARAVVDENGRMVYLTRGIAPLGNTRRGEDVVMTDALAFDVRVFDPGAPLYEYNPDFNGSNPPPALTVVQPGDPAWLAAYKGDIQYNVGSNTATNDLGNMAYTTSLPFAYAGQGAYVDLGYGFDTTLTPVRQLPGRQFVTLANAVLPQFFVARALSSNIGGQLAPGYSVYDTWSHHYENNGVNDDNDVDANGVAVIDEFTNGFDDRDPALAGVLTAVDNANDIARFGVDDPTERETTPPYDTTLRGMQVTLRGYERDSRQIREVKVRQTFVPK